MIALDNQAGGSDEQSMQKEILKGKFRLNISEKMAPNARIEKYA
jgi:hypothetical protein